MMRALIAMSGGVDSSTAAYLAMKKGYECVGANMRLFDGSNTKDAEDAAAAADRLGIPFHIIDLSAEFRCEVIDRFISAYENGCTPNPCVDCNHYIKFGAMFREAEKLGCDIIVTGHYARTECADGIYHLKKAADESKDQSYMLCSLTQDKLSRVYFPLGDMQKSQTRQIAEELGFPNARKHDSQDICFVPDGDYASVIEKYTGKTYPCGTFTDRDGNILGTHNGLIRYTVGQRRGLGVAFGRPVYVCGKDPASNSVILGDESELYSTELDIGGATYTAEPFPERFRAEIMVRYRRKAAPALITVTGENTLHAVFDEPQRAISPGQAAVIYDKDEVLGGGTILP
ncbi:MAG: tRNA 2-thiouridine(34) synthase MnmA [Oscillospiraceae bacterium]|nr:tRNA 2-thiouridine(34) synthase MnmA [Oscillospiraceae bacterium]